MLNKNSAEKWLSPPGLLSQQPQLPSPAEAPKLIAELEGLLLPQRSKKLRAVLSRRSRQAVFVFENMVDPHNCSAALRSLDGCSFQEAHLVEAGTRLWIDETRANTGDANAGDASAIPDEAPNRPCPLPKNSKQLSQGITQGSNRWLNLYWWSDINSAIAFLKKDGYQVLASQALPSQALPSQALPSQALPSQSMAENSHSPTTKISNRHSAALPANLPIPLPELDLSRPLALVFGNEHRGVSPAALKAADGYFSIPMYGFVASYNLSVSVALTAYHLRQAFPNLPSLDERTATQIYAAWLSRITKAKSTAVRSTAIKSSLSVPPRRVS